MIFRSEKIVAQVQLCKLQCNLVCAKSMHDKYEKIVVLALIFALTVLLLSTVVLLFLSLQAQKKRNQYSLELEQSRIYTKQFRDYKKCYEILQNQRHDMKHHISYMKELLQREEYDKMQEYIDAVIEELR